MTDEPERLDAPNQQVVRPDQSGPADEGSGGGKPPKAPKASDQPKAPEQPRTGRRGANPSEEPPARGSREEGA